MTGGIVLNYVADLEHAQSTKQVSSTINCNIIALIYSTFNTNESMPYLIRNTEKQMETY